MSFAEIRTALKFGQQLESEYRRRIAGQIPGEVIYFQHLCDSFSALRRNFKVDICHGSSHQVTFTGSSHPWARSNARCEISDLMVVAFRRIPTPSIRLTFIQVKLERGNSHLNSGVSHRTFKANLEQWDLLSRRPQIHGAYSTFQPNPDLLSGALLPSIGSFLFLTPPGVTCVNLAHYTPADLLQIHGSPPTKNAYLTSAVGQKIRSAHGHLEACAIETCTLFGAALHLHLIGTPLLGDNQAPRLATRKWLFDALNNDEDAKDNPMVVDLIDFLREQNQEITSDKIHDSAAYLPKNLILLKTDSE